MAAAPAMALGCLLFLLIAGQLATAARQPQDSSMAVERRHHKHKHPYSTPAGWFIQVSVHCEHTMIIMLDQQYIPCGITGTLHRDLVQRND
jgi:hypothetical protein